MENYPKIYIMHILRTFISSYLVQFSQRILHFRRLEKNDLYNSECSFRVEKVFLSYPFQG